MTATIQKDDLIAAMLPALRETFHLSLMPGKDTVICPADAQVRRAMLGATLARADVVAKRLGQKDDIYGVIGTTPAIVDGLRRYFADPSQVNLAMTLRSDQQNFNAAIDDAAPTAQAMQPYLHTLIPPTERSGPRGFGC